MLLTLTLLCGFCGSFPPLHARENPVTEDFEVLEVKKYRSLPVEDETMGQAHMKHFLAEEGQVLIGIRFLLDFDWPEGENSVTFEAHDQMVLHTGEEQNTDPLSLQLTDRIHRHTQEHFHKSWFQGPSQVEMTVYYSAPEDAREMALELDGTKVSLQMPETFSEFPRDYRNHVQLDVLETEFLEKIVYENRAYSPHSGKLLRVRLKVQPTPEAQPQLSSGNVEIYAWDFGLIINGAYRQPLGMVDLEHDQFTSQRRRKIYEPLGTEPGAGWETHTIDLIFQVDDALEDFDFDVTYLFHPITQAAHP